MLRTNFWKKGILLTLAALLIVVLATGCGKKDEGEVIATYKDGTVTQVEFDKYLAFFSILQPGSEMYFTIPQFKEQLLNQYIGYKVLNSRLGDKKDEEIEKEISGFYTEFEKQRAANEELKKKVEESNLSGDDMKNFYKMVISVTKDQDSKISDDDVKKQYEKAKAEFSIVSVRHVLVKTTERETGAEVRKDEEALKIAKEVKSKLEANGDWNAIAKQYSEDPGSKDNGGLYEDVEARNWTPEFKEASLKQEIGKIGDPVKSSDGYHVIKVEKRVEQAFDKLSQEAKNSLRQAIASERMNEFMTKELPGLIEKINLPKEEAPATDDAAKDNTGKTDEKAEETK
ncbi:peptidylprolyl isomerase [Paenibacillus oenotherae]|uniref:peptidylprolyl isomerase n=1 Tax=Paenibacillus oenotherae TaxID=1435645 RepID=A0ABS7DBS5_9BACL|nr:peptidylprolyl isomerase [Paenibacillus oenotherae]MBW7477394.1 peptidylprolyl isomerase [Paenibacillus oenotherae]